MKITPDQIELFNFVPFDDNSVLLNFDKSNVNYLFEITPEMVAQCARLNLWTTKYDIEGEDYQISLDGFMESDFGVEHAIELAIFYLKETISCQNLQ